MRSIFTILHVEIPWFCRKAPLFWERVTAPFGRSSHWLRFPKKCHSENHQNWQNSNHFHSPQTWFDERWCKSANLGVILVSSLMLMKLTSPPWRGFWIRSIFRKVSVEIGGNIENRLDRQNWTNRRKNRPFYYIRSQDVPVAKEFVWW